MNELPLLKVRILKKATELFMDFGMRCVSMDDIAEAAGCSKKTIYQHYKDKDDLVADAISSVLLRNQELCEAGKQHAENVIHEVFLAIDVIEGLFKSVNPSVLLDLKKHHPKAYNQYLKYKDGYMFDLVKNNILKGIEQGLFREDLNVEILSRFRVESFITPFQPEFYKKVNVSVSQVQKELSIYFLFGVATLKGHKLILKYLQKSSKN